MYAIREPGSMHEVHALEAFMKVPEIYWAQNDALSPPPEAVNFIGHLTHPDVATFMATYGTNIIGYVQFVRRSSIAAEMHVAFRKEFRGTVARAMVQYALASVFKRGLLKVWGLVPSDNRAAAMAARLIGMHVEGRLKDATVREDGLRDIVIFSISRDKFLAKG
jgi:RimJ/RimL family protein N-acetyltransferase